MEKLISVVGGEWGGVSEHRFSERGAQEEQVLVKG